MKKKVRINELARELEVKAHEILERLPELGVTEKKTHSSSIDEDVAIKLRRYYGFEVAEPEEETEAEARAAEAPEHPRTKPPAPSHRQSRLHAGPAAPAVEETPEA